MVLEGIIIIPRRSASSVPAIVIVVLFLLELLSQTKAVLHLVFGILVQGARAIEDLLVLLIIVALRTRLIDDSDEVVWPSVAILTGLGSFWPVMATVAVETTVVVAAVVVVSVVGVVIVAMR